MAISRYNTHRLLNMYPRVMGLNPWFFNQVSGAFGVDDIVATPRDFIFVQPEREMIVQGLLVADRLLTSELGFFYRPRFVHETAYWGQRGPIKTKYRYVHALGRRATELLEADSAVTYSDTNGDSTHDLATITLTLTEAIDDPAQIQVFFRVTDGAPVAADERYEIEPLAVSVVGLNVTLTGHRSLFVKPSLWAKPYNDPFQSQASKNPGSTDSPDDFITAVDVYRVYPDDTYRGYNILDSKDGLIDTSWYYWRDLCRPDGTFDLYYYAGYPLDPVTGLADPNLEMALARLANAKMPNPPSNFSDPRMNVWNHDWETAAAGTLPQNIIGNPFGVKNGEVAAWIIARSFLW